MVLGSLPSMFRPGSEGGFVLVATRPSFSPVHGKCFPPVWLLRRARSPRRSPSFLIQARLHPRLVPRAQQRQPLGFPVARPAIQRPLAGTVGFSSRFCTLAPAPCVRMRRPSGRPTLSSATFGVEHSWTSFALRPSHARPCSTCYSPSKTWPARMADSFLCRKPPCHAPSRQLDPRCHKALPFSLLGRSSSALSRMGTSLQLLRKPCCYCSSVSGGLPRSRQRPTVFVLHGLPRAMERPQHLRHHLLGSSLSVTLGNQSNLSSQPAHATLARLLRKSQVRPAPPSPDGPNGGGDGRSRSSHSRSSSSRSSSSSSSNSSSSSSRGHSRSGSGDHRDRGAHPADPSDNRHSPHCDNSRSNDLAGQTHQPDPGPAPVAAPDARRLRRSLSSLDSVDLLQVLQERAFTFQFAPSFARGPVRQALTFALSAIFDAGVNEDASMRAWKLWFLLPRLLLHRSPGVKKLPKQDWVARIAAFNEGRWLELLRKARQVQPPSHDPSLDTFEARADRSRQRARHLVHLGELSAARQALVASPLAPGTVETLGTPPGGPTSRMGPFRPRFWISSLPQPSFFRSLSFPACGVHAKVLPLDLPG